MSRVIKFRVWSESGEPLILEPGWLGDYHWGIGRGVDLSEAEPKVLEQFTGLKDRDGKDIYEGDIVQFIFGTGIDFDDRRTVTAQVIWHDEAAQFRFKVGHTDKTYLSFDPVIGTLTVVGNIHQHFAEFFGIACA